MQRPVLKQGVDGLHFYTMNRADTVTEVLRNLSLDRLLADKEKELTVANTLR